jgi:predicted dehydrogenase
VSDVRVGLAGFGLAGEVFHAPLVNSVDGLELTKVMTRNPERVEKARAQYPDAQVVGSADELIDDIDVLVVATPNRTHVEMGLAGLERDLFVVMDKPLAPSVEEARRLVGAGGKLTVFQNRRWDGDFLTLRRRIAEGALGDVHRFESRFDRFLPEVDAEGWRELADPGEGGGVLLDLGAHLVDQAVQLFGPPVNVYAEVASRREGAQVDDDVFVALEHAGEVHSHLWMSALAPNVGLRYRVDAAKAGFAADGLDPQEQQLIDGLRPGDAGYGEAAGMERGRYEDYYAGVRDWARGDAPAPVDPAESLRVMEILEAARRSADERQVVRFEETK